MQSLFNLVVVAVMTAPSLGQQLSLSCFAPDFTFDCTTFIPQFCNILANATVNTQILTIFVAPNDVVSRCFNVPSASGSCDLTTGNNLANPRIPSVQDCESALGTVGEVCVSGGSGQFSGTPFRFWLDPNAGACPIPHLT
ncbi:hypothetical protein DFH06DRAFT_1342559 [Mycena polygramma]|nr:hypothetical protein DFH06DRAFT_1342559 [Mycena polygramma]